MKVTLEFAPYELTAAIEKHLSTGLSVHDYIKQAVREKVMREETSVDARLEKVKVVHVNNQPNTAL